jgi:very-short-patch-repair endonuclease
MQYVHSGPNLRSRARALRKTMTHEEVKLWLALKALNKTGFHFRRQVPLDGYILDFAEFCHRLILEVDGSQHAHGLHELRDRRRDAHFVGAGFRVLRFWNIDIHANLDGCVETIVCALNESPPSASLRSASPP